MSNFNVRHKYFVDNISFHMNHLMNFIKKKERFHRGSSKSTFSLTDTYSNSFLRYY